MSDETKREPLTAYDYGTEPSAQAHLRTACVVCGNPTPLLNRIAALEAELAASNVIFSGLRDELAAEREKVRELEGNRQYHMNAINRLAKFLAFWGTSDDVIDAAMDNMKRFTREPADLRTRLEAAERDAETFAALPFIVEYRRKDGVLGSWRPMAAYDVESIAQKYAEDCSGETRPWEYRVRPQPDAALQRGKESGS